MSQNEGNKRIKCNWNIEHLIVSISNCIKSSEAKKNEVSCWILELLQSVIDCALDDALKFKKSSKNTQNWMETNSKHFWKQMIRNKWFYMCSKETEFLKRKDFWQKSQNYLKINYPISATSIRWDQNTRRIREVLFA